ncbi:MAG: hypothetical protein NZ932_07175 [Candidatus Bathyarchaeota archaeon]|nr:hypothetical protein [Candidatus Bathyarchaeota archaeon]MDW8039807.1 hypothetical protein [Nitrososphaerota archaeon]
MGISVEMRGLSTIALILLVALSAIVGGLISYAFTIVYYTKIPEETTLAITGVQINPENISSFSVSILNPSYSPTDATVSRIAVSLKNRTQLYEVVETSPSIKNGLKIQKGESVNVTCLKIRKDNMNVTFGEFAVTFAGEKILVHVFAEESPAANMEATIPYVKLDIAAEFDPRISFKKFNITLTNNPSSEINLTVTEILVPGVTIEGMAPDLGTQPIMVARGKSTSFRFNGSWYGLAKTVLCVSTLQGYVFRKEVEIKAVRAMVQNVNFDVDCPDHFNVTIYNLPGSAGYVNVTRIECRLDNGTALSPLDCGAVMLLPNSTRTFTFRWNWRGYRGRNVTVEAYFTQEFAEVFVAKTPSPIIVKVLNSTFSLLDKGHFRVVILNHASSLQAVNVTKFMVKKTGEVLPIANGLINPGYNKAFSCAFNWARFLSSYGRSLELTVYAVATQTLEEYKFDFSFVLPVAELDIMTVNHVVIGGTGYLNLTVKNFGYSIWNLTLAKIVIVVQGLSEPLEYTFPKNHVIIRVGDETVLLCPFHWQKYMDKSVTVSVITEESVEASKTYTIT